MYWWWIISMLIGGALSLMKYSLITDNNTFSLRNFLLLIFWLGIAGILFWKNDAPND